MCSCYFVTDSRTCFITSILMPIACDQYAEDGQSGRQDFALVDGVGCNCSTRRAYSMYYLRTVQCYGAHRPQRARARATYR